MKRARTFTLALCVVLAAAMLAASLIGCGNKKTVEEEGQNYGEFAGETEAMESEVIGEIEFDYDNLTILQDPDHPEDFQVVLQVINTSKDMGAKNLYVDVSLKNGEQITGNNSDLVFWVAPGEKRWTIVDISTAAAGADNAEVGFSSITAVEYDANTWPVVEARDCSIEKSYSSYILKGTFANNGPVDVGQAYYVWVCFDDSGNPVGCDWGYSEGKLPKGSIAPLEGYLDGNPGSTFVVEACATNSDF